MPFTFSHPAIVLPLAKYSGKWFSLTALVLGSIAPDFEYFIRMSIYGRYSHTVSGMFIFDLPLVLIVAFLYHNWVRNPLIDNLPFALKKRLTIYKTFNWNKYSKTHIPVVIISALIGILSHLGWDALTHRRGFFVQTWPVLQGHINIGSFSIAWYNFMQHFSSLVGICFVFIWLFRFPATKAVERKNNTRYWLIVFLVCAMVIAIRILWGLKLSEWNHLIASSITGFMLGLLAAPLAEKIFIAKTAK